MCGPSVCVCPVSVWSVQSVWSVRAPVRVSVRVQCGPLSVSVLRACGPGVWSRVRPCASVRPCGACNCVRASVRPVCGLVRPSRPGPDYQVMSGPHYLGNHYFQTQSATAFQTGLEKFCCAQTRLKKKVQFVPQLTGKKVPAVPKPVPVSLAVPKLCLEESPASLKPIESPAVPKLALKKSPAAALNLL
ncbi:hypothetical protein AVEN_223428-1 [Araneus ventricosus]|uniref:Uncharacterized protein n=1 Tax=Araneus ventricosus TaxID=182803 RepID=A0A4Y2RHQ0_ARAVE|nr:hypothetical protein AVEN_223428-1 [Araneus ventricosus]